MTYKLTFVLLCACAFYSTGMINAEKMSLICDELLGLCFCIVRNTYIILTLLSSRRHRSGTQNAQDPMHDLLHEDEYQDVYYSTPETESQLGYNSIYCTVSNFHVEYTTQVDCDVYPVERSNVKVVRFANSRMIYIPHGIFRYFINIREFDISSSHIEGIQRNFEGAQNLVFLIMSDNNITELGASLFVDAPMLTVVDFSHNHISKINKYAFAEARSLSRLVFSHNNISVLDERLFKDLRFLDQIFLDHNDIEIIPKNLFASNVMLQKVILSNNRIAVLHCQCYGGLKYLNTLHVAENRLTEFDPSCLENQLESINLSGNNLTTLVIKNTLSMQASNNSIKELHIANDDQSLEALYISNNSLLNIQNITNYLINLRTLDVSFNFVGQLNITTLSKLTKLVKLDLEHTGISHLDFGTFANQRELSFLDISYNNLNKFNWDILLPYLSKLEELYISGNNLTEIEGSGHVGHIFPQLRVLDITSNNFNCTYLSNFYRLLAYSKIRMSYDEDLLSNGNETHVHGIVCSSNQNQNISHEKLVTHLMPEHKYEFELLKTKMEYFYRNDMHLLHKIDALHSRMSSQEIQHEHLMATFRNLKYFVAGIAILGFIFIAVKFTRVYVENRYLKINLHSSGAFQSTATMNTLQSTIPY